MSSLDIDLSDNSCEEELYFKYSATLRIFGKDLDFQLINNTLNIQPTHMHKQGEYENLMGGILECHLIMICGCMKLVHRIHTSIQFLE